MRLDKYLSNSGIGTRSQVKKLIHDKRIFVNGSLAKNDSLTIDETKDTVLFDGKIVNYKKYYYVLLNKPKGYVSAVEDNLYPPITDLISEYSFANLFPVGRLDLDTTGTILLTNDGDLCHKLLAPKNHVNKTYYVTVDKKLDTELIKQFEKGIVLDGELTLPAKLNICDDFHAELTIHQGKFHQVKRMFQYFKYSVLELDRRQFAFLDCEGLNLGEYRELSSQEEIRLKSLIKQ